MRCSGCGPGSGCAASCPPTRRCPAPPTTTASGSWRWCRRCCAASTRPCCARRIRCPMCGTSRSGPTTITRTTWSPPGSRARPRGAVRRGWCPTATTTSPTPRRTSPRRWWRSSGGSSPPTLGTTRWWGRGSRTRAGRRACATAFRVRERGRRSTAAAACTSPRRPLSPTHPVGSCGGCGARVRRSTGPRRTPVAGGRLRGGSRCRATKTENPEPRPPLCAATAISSSRSRTPREA